MTNIYRVTWFPKGADEKLGSVDTCVTASTLIEALMKVSKHYSKDGEPYCVLTRAERIGEWILGESQVSQEKNQ